VANIEIHAILRLRQKEKRHPLRHKTPCQDLRRDQDNPLFGPSKDKKKIRLAMHSGEGNKIGVISKSWEASETIFSGREKYRLYENSKT